MLKQKYKKILSLNSFIRYNLKKNICKKNINFFKIIKNILKNSRFLRKMVFSEYCNKKNAIRYKFLQRFLR
jgi:hypothetical protein